ncbi:MAG: efflux RND transporter permease subunit [Nevskiales bacterium]
MEERLARWLTDWRHPLAVASLLVIAALAYGAKFLYFESDYRIFFRDDDPRLLAHEEQQAEYTKSDSILFIVAPADGEVFTRDTLAAVEELTAESWKMPLAIRVDSISNYQHTRASGDDLAVSDLISDAGSLSDAELAARRAIALAEPLLVNSLISDRGHVTAVNARLNLPDSQTEADKFTPEIFAFAEALRNRIQAEHPGLKIHLHGLVAVNKAFNDLSTADASTLVPVMFAVVVIMLAVFMRSISVTFATVVVIVGSIIVTVGFTGWIGYHLNQITVSTPTIILTLAISDCVHLMLIYLRGLGEGRTRVDAMYQTLRINLLPVFLTSFTTAIGFISLNFSDSPPFREMGNICAFGVMMAMVLSVTLLPSIVTMLPVRVRPGMGEEAHWKIVDRVGEFAIRRRVPVSICILIALAVTVAFIPRNDLNDSTEDYFRKGSAFREVIDFTEQNLTGMDSIGYSLPSGESGGISNPEYLRKVEAFAQWYKLQPEVRQVSSFTEIIKRLNRTMHGDDPAWHRVPEQRDLAAQYLLLYEMSLPFGLDLNSMVNQDKSATRFTVSIRAQKARQLIDIENRAQAWLSANAPEIAAQGSSVSLMFAHIGQNNIYSMINGAIVAIVLISLTMILSLRSLKFGLISLIPNALPAAMAFGLWGMLVGEVNLAAAGVYSITLGIIVDDTIHFFAKYLHARRVEGKSPEDAIRYAYATVGSALFVTTAVLICGFAVLTISDFTLNVTVGTMSATIIGIALFFDMLFLPALLMWIDRDKPQPNPIPAR